MTDRTRLPDRRLNETQEFDRDGIHITMTIGFDRSGVVREIFLNADRSNSMMDVMVHDAAIGISIALQHGATVSEIAHALKRDRFGIASSPIGAALDRISIPEVVNAEK